VFDGLEDIQARMQTPEDMAARQDMVKFVTACVTILSRPAGVLP
jgi:hypothetical protein